MSVTVAHNVHSLFRKELTLLNPLSWWKNGIQDVLLFGLVLHRWEGALPLGRYREQMLCFEQLIGNFTIFEGSEMRAYIRKTS